MDEEFDWNECGNWCVFAPHETTKTEIYQIRTRHCNSVLYRAKHSLRPKCIDDALHNTRHISQTLAEPHDIRLWCQKRKYKWNDADDEDTFLTTLGTFSFLFFFCSLSSSNMWVSLCAPPLRVDLFSLISFLLHTSLFFLVTLWINHKNRKTDSNSQLWFTFHVHIRLGYLPLCRLFASMEYIPPYFSVSPVQTNLFSETNEWTYEKTK